MDRAYEELSIPFTDYNSFSFTIRQTTPTKISNRFTTRLEVGSPHHGLTLEVPELSSARPALGCSSAISADKFWGTR
ncbi:hypothetical protein OUZ56_005440 [Daphnia magna]|uniref:Uncharacterized protein n=1 Tax=Daphnia magna TaxID=35525 RepID=A0ABQ9YSW6_9CRUS|nr:hypothetical protein OUZ56_005440 [Daphnia magna]